MEDRVRIVENRGFSPPGQDDDTEEGKRATYWTRPEPTYSRDPRDRELRALAIAVYSRFADPDPTKIEDVCARIVRDGKRPRDDLDEDLLTALDNIPAGRPHIRDHLPYPVYAALQGIAASRDRDDLEPIYTTLRDRLKVKEIFRCRDRKKIGRLAADDFDEDQQALIKTHLADNLHPDRPMLREGLNDLVYDRLCELFGDD